MQDDQIADYGNRARREQPHLILRWIPYEEFICEVHLVAGNGSFAASQRAYSDIESLLLFGRDLALFPTQERREVRFELGSTEENSAYYVSLRAYLRDSLGHAAIETVIDNRDTGADAAAARFHIHCEVAAINRLGAAIQRWVGNPVEPVVWIPK